MSHVTRIKRSMGIGVTIVACALGLVVAPAGGASGVAPHVTSVITGRVVSTVGVGIPGMFVTIKNCPDENFNCPVPTIQTRTDTHGYYAFTHVPPTVCVGVSVDAAALNWIAFAVTGGLIKSVIPTSHAGCPTDMLKTAGATVVMPNSVWVRGGRIIGIVRDASAVHAPIKGVAVTTRGMPFAPVEGGAVTDDAGAFVISQLPTRAGGSIQLDSWFLIHGVGAPRPVVRVNVTAARDTVVTVPYLPAPPTAPRNFRVALSGTPSAARVTLNWATPLSDGGRTITGYRALVTGSRGLNLRLTTAAHAVAFTTTASPLATAERLNITLLALNGVEREETFCFCRAYVHLYNWLPSLALPSSITGWATTPITAPTGRPLSLAGSVVPGFARAVWLQSFTAGAWHTLATGSSDSAGRFRVNTTVVAGTTQWRLYAPVASRYVAAATAPRSVTGT